MAPRRKAVETAVAPEPPTAETSTAPPTPTALAPEPLSAEQLEIQQQLACLRSPLGQAVSQILQDAQVSAANSRRALHLLRAEHVTHGTEAFMEVMCVLLLRVLSIRRREASVERLVKLFANYGEFLQKRSRVAQDASQSVAEDGEARPPAKTADRRSKRLREEDQLHYTLGTEYNEALLRFLLRGVDSRNKLIRFRICQLCVYLIVNISDLDPDLYEEALDRVGARTNDVDSLVRIQSVYFLSNFQGSVLDDDSGNLAPPPLSRSISMSGAILDNTEDPEEDLIIRRFSELIRVDQSGSVRKAVLDNIDRTPRNSHVIVERSRDVDPRVRRYLFRRIVPQIEVTFFSPKQRVVLLGNGLRDQDETIRKACSLALNGWIRGHYKSNLLSFLSDFDVLEHADTLSLALRAFFNANPSVVMPIDTLLRSPVPDSALLARAFCEHISEKPSPRYDEAVPELTRVATALMQVFMRILTLCADPSQQAATIASLVITDPFSTEDDPAVEGGAGDGPPLAAGGDFSPRPSSAGDLSALSTPGRGSVPGSPALGNPGLGSPTTPMDVQRRSKRLANAETQSSARRHGLRSPPAAPALSPSSAVTELAQLSFCYHQLLLICNTLDTSDEVGRMNMMSLLGKIIVQPTLSSSLWTPTVKSMCKLHVTELDFVDNCVELIHSMLRFSAESPILEPIFLEKSLTLYRDALRLINTPLFELPGAVDMLNDFVKCHTLSGDPKLRVLAFESYGAAALLDVHLATEMFASFAELARATEESIEARQTGVFACFDILLTHRDALVHPPSYAPAVEDSGETNGLLSDGAAGADQNVVSVQNPFLDMLHLFETLYDEYHHQSEGIPELARGSYTAQDTLVRHPDTQASPLALERYDRRVALAEGIPARELCNATAQGLCRVFAWDVVGEAALPLFATIIARLLELAQHTHPLASLASLAGDSVGTLAESAAPKRRTARGRKRATEADDTLEAGPEVKGEDVPAGGAPVAPADGVPGSKLPPVDGLVLFTDKTRRWLSSVSSEVALLLPAVPGPTGTARGRGRAGRRVTRPAAETQAAIAAAEAEAIEAAAATPGPEPTTELAVAATPVPASRDVSHRPRPATAGMPGESPAPGAGSVPRVPPTPRSGAIAPVPLSPMSASMSATSPPRPGSGGFPAPGRLSFGMADLSPIIGGSAGGQSPFRLDHHSLDQPMSPSAVAAALAGGAPLRPASPLAGGSSDPRRPSGLASSLGMAVPPSPVPAGGATPSRRVGASDSATDLHMMLHPGPGAAPASPTTKRGRLSDRAAALVADPSDDGGAPIDPATDEDDENNELSPASGTRTRKRPRLSE
ncbi:hypothetical protein H696_00914 [Fonticula alba]|uniref:Nuclear condensin complex subunit 3 C-terminal domain-containing protein n=1 Tax=Fonticula alba TaxID=691883 RepID=A0A058ZG53_FONAL|nr:hypothetical protein H696_00914 [Fonticula alba]KCV73375.1 hypothetical protein H696_00914 [Fonticula alba]|eukprot:XP_009493076.1 hypothetical protein H696_00914 [Fonticula alba]